MALKNNLTAPIKDGVKADNSTYSSNKIEALLNNDNKKAVKNILRAPIKDGVKADNSTYSSNKIEELIAASGSGKVENVILIQKSEYDLINPEDNILYIVLELINVSGDGGGSGVYRYYYYYNNELLNPDDDWSDAYDIYYKDLFFNAGGSVYKSDNEFKFFSSDNINRDWTIRFKAHNFINTTKYMIGMSRTSAPCWYIENAGNQSNSTLYLKGDVNNASQTLNLENIQDVDIIIKKVDKKLEIYKDGVLFNTLDCDITATANSDWFRIGAVTSSGSTFNGIFEYVACKWGSAN